MSTINTGSINVSYPTPGVNNSTQGFRDNFTAIKTNLDTASAEISDLQSKAIVKSALAGASLNNDMNNTRISNAQTLGFRASTFNLGNNLSGVVTIDLSKGDVHYGTITGNVTLNFTKWAPAGTRSVVQVMLTVTDPTLQISFPSAVKIGVSTIENCVSNVVTLQGSLGLDVPSVLHYEFSTTDCGITVEIEPINRPRKATQLTTTVPSTAIGSPGDKAGTVASNSSYVYVCTANYDGTTHIWKRLALAAW